MNTLETIKAARDMAENARSAWARANDAVPVCPRCTSWNAMGLSSRCPGCDMKILRLYDMACAEAKAVQS